MTGWRGRIWHTCPFCRPATPAEVGGIADPTQDYRRQPAIPPLIPASPCAPLPLTTHRSRALCPSSPRGLRRLARKMTQCRARRRRTCFAVMGLEEFSKSNEAMQELAQKRGRAAHSATTVILTKQQISAFNTVLSKFWQNQHIVCGDSAGASHYHMCDDRARFAARPACSLDLRGGDVRVFPHLCTRDKQAGVARPTAPPPGLGRLDRAQHRCRHLVDPLRGDAGV